MAFSEAQKQRFVGLLETKGWQMCDGTIYSPSGGLWFSSAHFGGWSPSQMYEIFSRRGKRIAKEQLDDWQVHSRENQEASFAAEQVIDI